MRKMQDILDRIDQLELKKAQDDFIENEYYKDPDKLPAFEIDGNIHTVPYRTLRHYLQTGDVPKESSSPTFRNRIPDLIVKEEKELPEEDLEEDDDLEDGYYWDSNYNYEYMNPESKRQKVLGKIKK